MKLVNKIALVLSILVGVIVYQQIELHQIRTELQGIESFIVQWSE